MSNTFHISLAKAGCMASVTPPYKVLKSLIRPLGIHYSPITTHYSLLITNSSLFTTHYSPLTTHYSLHNTHDSTAIANLCSYQHVRFATLFQSHGQGPVERPESRRAGRVQSHGQGPVARPGSSRTGRVHSHGQGPVARPGSSRMGRVQSPGCVMPIGVGIVFLDVGWIVAAL